MISRIENAARVALILLDACRDSPLQENARSLLADNRSSRKLRHRKQLTIARLNRVQESHSGCYAASASSAPRSVFCLVRASPFLSWTRGP
jgi:hypothetical protein